MQILPYNNLEPRFSADIISPRDREETISQHRDSVAYPLIGQSFGKCRLRRLLGHGGMGSVYLAEHLFLRRPVAIKILSFHLRDDAEVVERFEREAITAAKLDHPNIVRIHDVDELDGVPFLIMEYVEGENLETAIHRDAPFSMRKAASITKAVTQALDHAHSKGVIHRDIKPGNILLGKDGQIKITDFGLAKDLGRPDQTLVSGMVLGTPYYVSPEQAKGERLDGRSDLYSLGVTLYSMLTAQRPFEGSSASSVIRKHVYAPRPSPLTKRPALARSLSAIVQKMIAQNRSDRYSSAKELLLDLTIFLSGKPFLDLRNRRKRPTK